MPKRVPEGEVIDPVRSRLAASAAAPHVPAAPLATPEAVTRERTEEEGRGSESPQSRRAPKFVSRDKLAIHRKVMFTQEEADRNEETAEMVAKAFGNPATYSQITRAMWSVLTSAEEGLKTSGKRARQLSRPSKGDHVGMAEYEYELAQFLASALRRP